MQDLYDRRVNIKTLQKALKVGPWKAGEIIRNINQEVRIKEGKNTKAGWVLASRVAAIEDVTVEDLVKTFLELESIKKEPAGTDSI